MWYLEVAGALFIILILLLVLRSMQKSRKAHKNDKRTAPANESEVESPLEMATQEPLHEQLEVKRESQGDQIRGLVKLASRWLWGLGWLLLA